MSTDRGVEDLLRRLTPPVLGALTRRYGVFDRCEDAVQEALLAAATQWPVRGLPDDPAAWLITAASRRLTDQIRSEAARRRREERAASLEVPGDIQPPGTEITADRDDSLLLLFLCCHPMLTQASQIALTLRSVGGLTTAQIAAAFL
ncbi:MAG TPA: sigma factor, partial [Streptosporangiaceae bacterium]|nr:sigma factor [Streptosporangiaceae bacterium]